MNRPRDRGADIDTGRFNWWLSRFAGYRNPVTRGMIELWLRQFSPKDQDLAARVLDAILFISNQHIHICFRNLLDALNGWNQSASRRRGRWFFVPFSGSAGESGDSMVHTFRMATSMNKKKYNDLFIHRSELVIKKPGPTDTVVLLDDFSGTGNQACESWRVVFSELLAGGPRIVLMLVAATKHALDRITEETEMEPICGTTLRGRDNIFHSDCTHFSSAEKDALLTYCTRADSGLPKGYGSAGLIIVLAHQCPNNTIPILHANHGGWQGLFPRHN
ncbi:MAG: phosphoribosyltransferase-like protein [Candidatus Binatia bacterium]